MYFTRKLRRTATEGCDSSLTDATDGSTVLVDEAYIRESILEPQAKVAKGFQPLMPKLPMSDAEIKEIVSFYRESKRGVAGGLDESSEATETKDGGVFEEAGSTI